MVAHALFLHWYGVHEICIVAVHVPLPLHVELGLSVVELMHVAEAQGVPEAHCAHCPAPLHAPVVQHEDAAVDAHSLSGSALFAIGPQTPSIPLPFLPAEHAWHAPVQALLQQTLSTQLAFRHSLLKLHVPPSDFFGTHWLALQ